MSGWCVANLFDLSPRERFLAMVAASAADVDGVGIFVSWDLYTEYHHVIAHNAMFGVLLALPLAVFSKNRVKAFCLFLSLYHLHLVLDYYGSGLGWGIAYFWPFSEHQLQNPGAWELSSWQNFIAGGFLVGWMILIAVRQRRSPLEFITPSMDKKIVAVFRKEA